MLVLLRQRILSKYPSLGAFCKAVEIKQPQLSKIIHCKRRLRATDQQRWAKILNTEKEELFKTSIN